MQTKYKLGEYLYYSRESDNFYGIFRVDKVLIDSHYITEPYTVWYKDNSRKEERWLHEKYCRKVTMEDITK